MCLFSPQGIGADSKVQTNRSLLFASALTSGLFNLCAAFTRDLESSLIASLWLIASVRSLRWSMNCLELKPLVALPDGLVALVGCRLGGFCWLAERL